MDGRKHTTLEAGGKIYNLRVSYNALAMFEERIGSIQMFSGKGAKVFSGFRGLVWAAINACGKDITLEEAGDICEAYSEENGIEAFHAKMEEIQDASGWLTSKKGAGTKNKKVKPKEPSKK